MKNLMFQQLFNKIGLYAEENGKCRLAIFSHTEFLPAITFAEAIGSPDVSFIYADVSIANEDEAEAMLQKCETALQEQHASRGVLWLTDTSTVVLSLSEDFTTIQDTFRVAVDGTEENGIDVKLSYGAKLTIQEDGILRLHDKSNFSFGELQIPMRLYNIGIALLGEHAGTLLVEAGISGNVFDSIFKCGFEYGFTDDNGQLRLISNRLFDKNSIRKTDLTMRFEFGFHALSGNMMRFLPSQSPLTFLSNFRTLYGELVYLSPVTDETDSGGISFLPRISEEVCSAPLGAYTVSTKRNSDIVLVCGFAGTELIQLPQNSKIYFVPNQPAFSPYFPEREFSINDFVEPPVKALLSDVMVTSWVAFYGSYVSQPLEAPFFSGAGSVLALADLQTDFSKGSPAVPLMLYHDIKAHDMKLPAMETNKASSEQISGFERVVLTNERGNRLHEHAIEHKHMQCIKTHPDNMLQYNEQTTTAATPSGFVGQVYRNQFQKISLAFSPLGDLAFTEITDVVSAAFFSASMFCVFANSDHLGKFQNIFSIEDWQFSLTPGKGSSYNQYANIILVKGVRGKIYDPENVNASLCCNVGQWTCKEYFSKPAEGEYPNLSNWILNYCKDALERSCSGDAYYDNFVKIITDEAWKGVLALNVSLHAADFPECLLPLLAGVPDVSQICAHHIGADIVSLEPTERGPVNHGFSPFFGYIHYEAEGYCGTVMPIQNPAAIYEFKLLEMNVLFEKGKLKEFNSASQFVLGMFLSQKPTVGGCLYNALLLSGALQNNNGHSVLMLTSDGGALVFSNMPLAKVVVTGITMITIQAQEMEYAFDMTGQISFCQTEGIDVFSYDTLSFSGYKVHLLRDVFNLDVSAVHFDLSVSNMRSNSLCKTFSLVPFAVYNSAEKIAAFTGIAVEGFKNSKLSESACGIVCSVCLGGLGTLSTGSDLTAKILLAWDEKGKQFAGIQLPGEAMIQNVIGITFGDVRLTYKNGALVLYISKVALELLGLLKLPSSGAIQLALTGNDKGIGWYAAYQTE